MGPLGKPQRQHRIARILEEQAVGSQIAQARPWGMPCSTVSG